MQAFRIEDLRTFMSALLTGSAFHHFEVVEASLTTFVTFHIDGLRQRGYFDEDPSSEDPSSEEKTEKTADAASPRYITWETLQPHMYELIRGKRTPLLMRLVLRLSDANTAKVLESSHLSYRIADIAGLYLNIRFEKGTASCITGTSLNIFTADKNLEHTWDELIAKLLRKEQIAFTVM